MSLYYFWCLTHLSLIDCSSRGLQSRVGHAWIGCMDWIGLDWIGLDWIGLDWIGCMDWMHGLDWIGLDWWEDCYIPFFYSVTIAAQFMLLLSHYDSYTFSCPGFTTIESQHLE